MANSIARTIEEELTCPICFLFFIEPKVLPNCGHVVCEPCLRQLLSNNTDENRTDKCPECREPIGFRTEAVGNLKTNIRLRNLAQEVERCSRNNGTDGQTDESNFAAASYNVHPEEKVHLFCVKCNVLACHSCVLEYHNEHHFTSIAETCKKLKSEIQVILKDQRRKVEVGKEAVNKLEEQMNSLNKSLNSEENSIAEFTKQRIDEIEKDDRMLRAMLTEVFSSKMELMQLQIAETKEEVKKAESVHENIEQAMTKLSDSRYVNRHNRFVGRLKSLQVHKFTKTTHRIALPVAKFVRKQSGTHKTGRVVVLERESWKAKADLVQAFITRKLFLLFPCLQPLFICVFYIFGLIMRGIFSFGTIILMTILACWNYLVTCLCFMRKWLIRLQKGYQKIINSYHQLFTAVYGRQCYYVTDNLVFITFLIFSAILICSIFCFCSIAILMYLGLLEKYNYTSDACGTWGPWVVKDCECTSWKSCYHQLNP